MIFSTNPYNLIGQWNSDADLINGGLGRKIGESEAKDPLEDPGQNRNQSKHVLKTAQG